MKFSIATIEFWQSVGFDVSNWRKSIDGTKALCHTKYGIALAGQYPDDIKTFDRDSEEFKLIMELEFGEDFEEIESEVAYSIEEFPQLIENREKVVDRVKVLYVEALIRADEITAELLEEYMSAFPKWDKDAFPYEKDDRFRYEGKLYEVIQPHTSLENWKPSELPALYKEILPKQVIPQWKKPTGAHDAYKIGDKVIFEGNIYTSKINSNTWSPTEYAQGWQKE